MTVPIPNTNERPSVAEVIQQATRVHHQRLERSSISKALMSEQLSLCQYANILGYWYFAWSQLDKWLAANKPNNLEVNTIYPEARSELLQNDINAIAINEFQPLRLSYDKPFEMSLPGAWYGVAYVVEGSRLGSRFISRHLRSTLCINRNSGLSFFYDDVKSSGLDWQTWLRLFNQQAEQQDVRDHAISGAISVYQWLTQVFNEKRD